MVMQYPHAGLNNSGEYSAPGLPWVRTSNALNGTPEQLNFEYVSRDCVIKNNASSGGADLFVGFSVNGIVNGPERYRLKPGEEINFSGRFKEIYIMGVSGTPEYSIYAGLTFIPESLLPSLTGSAPVSWDGVG